MLPLPNSANEPCLAAPASFFRALGNMHDARVIEFQWNPTQREMAIAVNDLYANFAGLPEYPGLQPVRLVVSGVCGIQIDVTTDKFPARIMDLEVEQPRSDSQLEIAVKFDPSGSMKICCGSVACRPIALSP